MANIKLKWLAVLLLLSVTAFGQVQFGNVFKIGGTKFQFSTVNSSASQLAPAATFSGAVESVTEQQSYSVLFFSDQNATITINQYIDAAGTKLISTLPFNYTANGQFARSGALNGNYCKVTVTNTGSSTTTTLQLDVAYGTIPSATQLNNSPIAINEIGGAATPIVNVQDNTAGLPIRPVPQREFRSSFSAVRSSFNPLYWNTIITGSGMTATQASGNGIITTGTTANSETIIRSNEAFSGAMTMRVKAILSQRIVNQNFFIELVDVIGDGRAITINSATSVTVTYPAGHGFTSENVGQFTYLGAYVGTGTFIPGRYAIASVSGDNITYTVAGFAAGSGTCSVYGWNYQQITYNGTTATNSLYDAQREGWASGTTTATINTTAAPGHVSIINVENGLTMYADQLVATTTTNKAIIERASRVENVPGTKTNLYLQIRAVNGSTAPASTTTFTLGFASVEDYVPIQTSIVSTRAQSTNATIPTVVQNVPAVTISGTPSVNSTPVTYATNGTTTTNLNSAATTNATLVKSTAGIVYTIQANNTTAAAKYLRLYNLTTAPTVGTSTPVMVITIPASSSITVPIGLVGLKFATGISFAITNAATYLDATAVAAGDVQLLINYQ